MEYTPKYFKQNMPEWKKRKDSIPMRLFYRPLSFYVASFCANRGITANIVSVFSTIIAVITCALFLIDDRIVQICGAILFSVWLLLDCVDGNLARSMRQQPFGEFVDAVSSYVLVGLMGVCIGYSVYCKGGSIVSVGCPWMIVMGALGSSADSLMRLIYQKYQNTSKELQRKGIIHQERDIRTEHRSVGSLRVRIETELGIAGIIPIAILICSIVGALDIIIIYIFLYYGGACIITVGIYIYRSMQYLDISMKDIDKEAQEK